MFEARSISDTWNKYGGLKWFKSKYGSLHLNHFNDFRISENTAKYSPEV